MNPFLRTQPRGFAALISAVLVAAALTLAVFAASAGSWYARADALEREYALGAHAAAAACAQVAQLEHSLSGVLPGTLTVGGGETCAVVLTGASFEVLGSFEGSWSMPLQLP